MGKILHNLKLLDAMSLIILLTLVTQDVSAWVAIVELPRGSTATHAYFLDVGQGDAEIIVFPGNIKVMTDAGPTNKVLESLGKALAPEDTYIDLAIISHPQLDHFNGYNFMLDHYRIGAFIYNGRDDSPGVKEWPALLAKIKEKGIPLLTLAAQDTIRYGTNEIDLISPNTDFAQSAELNDTGFVEVVKGGPLRVLLTADTGSNVEDFLISQKFNVHTDILKVGHHGSRFSSDDVFLRAVNPSLAVIEVGAKNTYGHPAKQTLGRLASSTRAIVLRTDLNGTIDAWKEGGSLKFLKEKP